MFKKDRLDRIRRVRSVNDVLEIVGEIRKESENSIGAIGGLGVSLSATGDEEIKITHAPGKTRKIKTSSRRSKTSFTGQVKNYKAPPKANIEKHVAVLDSLYDNARELDAIEATLKQSFAGIKSQGEALKGVRALKKTVDASIQKALTALNTVAMKHFPEEMIELRDQLTSFLIDNIPEKQYDDMGFLEYANLGDRPGEIVFSVYVELENLRNNNGFVFDEYFIILTGVVNSRGQIAYYVNALPDFRTPGKYARGTQIMSERDMEHRVSQLLAHNDIITDLDRAPMPLHDDDAKTKGFANIKGVKSVKVADDALYLEVAKADARTDNNIAKETILLLNQVMRRKKDANISWKPVSKGGKRYLKFILYFKPGSAPKNLNLAKLNEIADIFELNDVQLRNLRRSLLD